MGFFYLPSGIARPFAAGVALAGLMLVFLGASLLVFPFKVTADPKMQGEVLYNILGHLELQADGRFAAVDDPLMRAQLKQIIKGNHLDGREGSAYIVEQGGGKVVWSASGFPLAFDTSSAENHYEMQLQDNGGYHLAIQNFWMKNANGERLEFRMVVALLAN